MANPKEAIFYGGFTGGASFAQTLREALPSLNGETPDEPVFPTITITGQKGINHGESVADSPDSQPNPEL